MIDQWGRNTLRPYINDTPFGGAEEAIPDGEAETLVADVADEDDADAARVEFAQAGEKRAGDGGQIREGAEGKEVGGQAGKTVALVVDGEDADGFACGEELLGGIAHPVADGGDRAGG